MQNWSQVPLQQTARAAPSLPGAAQSIVPGVATNESNPTPSSQRTLAWTGHLEWQDAVSENINYPGTKLNSAVLYGF